MVGDQHIFHPFLNTVLVIFFPINFPHRNFIIPPLLVLGAKSLGYPGVTHGLFPRGGVELVHYFYRSSNEKLIIGLEKKIADQGQQSIK